METFYPDIFSTRFNFDEISLRTLSEKITKSLSNSTLPPLSSWAIIDSEKFIKMSLDTAMQEIEENSTSLRKIGMRLKDNTILSIFKSYQSEQLNLSIDQVVDEKDAISKKELLEALVGFTKNLASEEVAFQGNVFHVGRGAECLPVLPLIKGRSNVVVAKRNTIEQYFKSITDFENSGWDSVEEINDLLLATRAFSFSDNIHFLKQVLDHQWQLARGLKPGHIRFSQPLVKPEEHSIYHSGERVLDIVGYYSDKKTLEMSCGILGEAHINGWEIFDIWGALKKKSLPDGSPLEEVQVFFIDPQVAERESTPLLDAGARVFFYNLKGSLEELA